MTSKVQLDLQLRVKPTGGIVNFSWSPTQPTINEPDSYVATAFLRSGGQLQIPRIDQNNVAEIANMLNAEEALRDRVFGPKNDIHVYVCTHMARDCRCGETGGQVADALRAEVSHRPEGHRIHVAETAHVGGHKYAANVLVYPHGEWFGMVKRNNVPGLVDAIINYANLSVSPYNVPLLPEHWRGRMGLDKEAQIKLLSDSQNAG